MQISWVRAIGVGVGVGAAASLLTLGVGALSWACCVLGMLNWLGPGLAGLVGGAMAAAVQPWEGCPPGEGAAPGAKAAAVGGALSSAATALTYLVVVILKPIASVALQALIDSRADATDLLIAAFVSEVMAVVWGGTVAVVSTLVGMCLAVGAGAVVGSLRAS